MRHCGWSVACLRLVRLECGRLVKSESREECCVGWPVTEVFEMSLFLPDGYVKHVSAEVGDGHGRWKKDPWSQDIR